MAEAVVSCVSLAIITILLDVLRDLFPHLICRCSIHDHRLRLLPNAHYCVP